MFDDERGLGGDRSGAATATSAPADPGWEFLEVLRVRLAEEFDAATDAELHAWGSAPLNTRDAADVLDRVAHADVTLCHDQQLLDAARELETLRRSLDAASLHVLAELDHRETTDNTHGLHTGAWLAADSNLPPATCRAKVRLALRLRSQLDDVDVALTDGRIGVDHARVLADAAANPRITDTLLPLIPQLLDDAAEMRFEPWRRHVTTLVTLLDQDGPTPDDEPLERNTLSLTRGLAGTWNLRGQLTNELGTAVHAALHAEADRLFQRHRNDEDQAAELRCPPRRTLLALALHEITRHHTAGSHTGPGPATDVALHINAADPHHACFDDSTPIGDTGRLTLLCDPVLTPIVMGMHRSVLEVGRQERLATTAQRGAMAARDGGCVFPGCDAPPTWTDAHHVLHWLHGGPTDLDNLASLCRHHHGVTHRTGWTMTVTDDEWFWWTTPRGHTIWSQRHGQQRAGPTPRPDTS